MNNTSIELLNGAFLGRQLENLSSIIGQQSKLAFRKFGIVAPVKSCSTLLLIRNMSEASAADLAREAKSSHQLIKQKIEALTKLCLIECNVDDDDKRRKIYTLTTIGRQQCEKIDEILPAFTKAYEALYAEIGEDLFNLCKLAEDRLLENPLINRVK